MTGLFDVLSYANMTKVFDRDNTGTISRDELRDVMRSIGEDFTEAEIDDMMQLADKDGNNTIDCEFFSLT